VSMIKFPYVEYRRELAEYWSPLLHSELASLTSMEQRCLVSQVRPYSSSVCLRVLACYRFGLQRVVLALSVGEKRILEKAMIKGERNRCPSWLEYSQMSEMRLVVG
jgi:hypothetical protein